MRDFLSSEMGKVPNRESAREREWRNYRVARSAVKPLREMKELSEISVWQEKCD